MKSVVADTSLEAYIQKQPELEGDRAKVYETIETYGPITMEETANRLGKYPHTISGRFTELRDQDLIEVIGKTQNQNGNTVRKYDVT